MSLPNVNNPAGQPNQNIPNTAINDANDDFDLDSDDQGDKEGNALANPSINLNNSNAPTRAAGSFN